MVWMVGVNYQRNHPNGLLSSIYLCEYLANGSIRRYNVPNIWTYILFFIGEMIYAYVIVCILSFIIGNFKQNSFRTITEVLHFIYK